MSSELAQGSFERALALCDLGRLEDAEQALREALRHEPDNPLAHAILASVLLGLDRPAEALESASTTIALVPDLAFGHEVRAQALLSLSRPVDAEAAAREAIRIDPEDADTWGLLAGALLGQERWDDSLWAVDHALSIAPDSKTALGLQALAFAMSRDGADWQDAAGRTLAVAPDSSLAHAFSGQAHLLRGREREAVEHFREALRLDPESEFAQTGLADAMKAAHPLFRPYFRYYVWQSRLPRGWRIALLVGPLLAVRALTPAAKQYPVLWVLIGLWLLFVASTWLAVPLANVVLRFSGVGRAVLPAEQKRSSTVFLAFMGAALVAVVLAVAVYWGFALGAFVCAFLALSVGSAHHLAPMRKRIVYVAAIAIGLVSFAGAALIPVRVGSGSLGALIYIVALLAAGALLWVVRLA
jgi:tetratricopeptide (TPR) repeat protein